MREWHSPYRTLVRTNEFIAVLGSVCVVRMGVGTLVICCNRGVVLRNVISTWRNDMSRLFSYSKAFTF